ncbi:hypothetical protein Q4I28_000142, partial [Leishmania naiffi]
GAGIGTTVAQTF